jgi:hypothetical protein
MHLACAEAYIVIEGSGAVETVTWAGFRQTTLSAGTVVHFTPGTIHRLINQDHLGLIVVMANSGLPEAGDAVLTFPAEVLADPAAYRQAATVNSPGEARRRRDLAIEGFGPLRDGGTEALAAFYRAAATLVAPQLREFERRWRCGTMAAADLTGVHLDRLRRGDLSYLRDAQIVTVLSQPALGMCGSLDRYEESHGTDLLHPSGPAGPAGGLPAAPR